MMNKKARRHISLILTSALALSCMVPLPASAAVKNFYDVRNTIYESAVGALTDEGIIDGYDDGSFRPDGLITRAEVSKILGSVIQKSWGGTVFNASDSDAMASAAKSLFGDLDGASWAAPYVGISARLNIVNGYGNGTFKPSGNITYNELAAMAVRACNYSMEGVELSWPANYQAAAEALGIFEGTGGIDLGVDGDKPATRGNVAVVVKNAMAKIEAAAAAGYPKTSASDGSVKALTLDEAIEIMKTTGMQAETAVINRDGDKATLKAAKDNVSSIRSALDMVDAAGSLDLAYTYQQQGVSSTNLKILQFQRDFMESMIEPNYEADMNNIEASTRKLYYAIVMLQANVSNSEADLALQERQLEIIKAKHELGMASDIQVTSQESAVKSAKSTLESNRQTLLSTQMQFNMAMNLPLGTKLELTTPLEQAETEELLSVDEAVEKMLSESLQIKYIDYNTELLTMTVNSLRYTTSTSSGSYQQKVNSLNSLKTSLAQLKVSMEQDMRASYASLDKLSAAIESMKSTVALTETALDLAKTQYSLGMGTAYDVASAEYNLAQAKLGLTSAIVDYNNAVDGLRFSAGIGTSRISFSAQ